MILNANALHIPLADATVQTCVTSPPYYGLRDYGDDNQIGLEETPEAYVDKLVQVFREVKRVLRDDGTLWLNLGDSYATNRNDHVEGGFGDNDINKHSTIAKRGRFCPDGLKMKDLIGIPWRVAFALQADGWYLRSDIIWHKPNPMPESVKDRPTKAHEYIFLLSKSPRYYYDADAIMEDSSTNEGRPAGIVRDRLFDYDSKQKTLRSQRDSFKRDGKNGQPNKPQKRLDRNQNEYDTGKRNKRSVWTVTTKPYSGAHFATFPPDLITPCILAGSAEGDVVLDPFSGSGTTGQVAIQYRRRYVGLELNMEYIALSKERTTVDVMLPMFA